jgi:hypothetical protein
MAANSALLSVSPIEVANDWQVLLAALLSDATCHRRHHRPHSRGYEQCPHVCKTTSVNCSEIEVVTVADSAKTYGGQN